jgi:hypothetical protein
LQLLLLLLLLLLVLQLLLLLVLLLLLILLLLLVLLLLLLLLPPCPSPAMCVLLKSPDFLLPTWFFSLSCLVRREVAGVALRNLPVHRLAIGGVAP